MSRLPIHLSKVALVESNSRPGGMQLVNAKTVNKNSDPMDLVELAKSVQKADDFVKATASSKLTVIAEQVRFLQEQARKVLQEAKRDAELHHAACNMVKKPGTKYYLYRRESGQTYLSILSPEEWGASCPHTYLAAYRLEYDMSWTALEDMERRDNEMAVIDKILHTSSQFAITDYMLNDKQSSKSSLKDTESENNGS